MEAGFGEERLWQELNRLRDESRDREETAATYRHAMRSDIQKLVIDLELIKLNVVSLPTLQNRVSALETERVAVKGGVSVLEYAWKGIAAIALVAIAWALGRYAT